MKKIRTKIKSKEKTAKPKKKPKLQKKTEKIKLGEPKFPETLTKNQNSCLGSSS
jgi:hypothetical protein